MQPFSPPPFRWPPKEVGTRGRGREFQKPCSEGAKGCTEEPLQTRGWGAVDPPTAIHPFAFNTRVASEWEVEMDMHFPLQHSPNTESSLGPLSWCTQLDWGNHLHPPSPPT